MPANPRVCPFCGGTDFTEDEQHAYLCETCGQLIELSEFDEEDEPPLPF